MRDIFNRMDLIETFSQKDVSGDGYLSKLDAIYIVEKKFPNLSERTVISWVDAFDTQYEHRVKYEEFISCFTYFVAK